MTLSFAVIAAAALIMASGDAIQAREVKPNSFALTVNGGIALTDLDRWTDENCVDRATCAVRVHRRGDQRLIFTSDRAGDSETRRVDCAIFASDDDHSCLSQKAALPMTSIGLVAKSKSVPAQRRRRRIASPSMTASQPAARTNRYFANCREARAAGYAPLRRGSPGYREALDRDGDGKACE